MLGPSWPTSKLSSPQQRGVRGNMVEIPHGGCGVYIEEERRQGSKWEVWFLKIQTQSKILSCKVSLKVYLFIFL